MEAVRSVARRYYRLVPVEMRAHSLITLCPSNQVTRQSIRIDHKAPRLVVERKRVQLPRLVERQQQSPLVVGQRKALDFLTCQQEDAVANPELLVFRIRSAQDFK